MFCASQYDCCWLLRNWLGDRGGPNHYRPAWRIQRVAEKLPIVSGFSWYQALCSIQTASNSLLQRPSSVHFSTMNRIASSQRCRLLLDHVCRLIEGPDVLDHGLCLDVRYGTDSQQQAFDQLINTACKVAGTAKTGLQLLNWIFQFSCSSRLCCMPMNWTVHFELWTTNIHRV